MKPLPGLFAFALACNLAAGAEALRHRPNILWFVVEDTSASAFSCYGEKTISTPNVDRLAREGTRFAHAFTTAPVCSASRSALITGMYQTSIGAHHHRSGRGVLKIQLPEPVVPVPALFQAAGYYTCIGSGMGRTGGGRRSTDEDGPGLGKTDYNFDWDRSIYDGNDWAERRPDQPFFMQVMIKGAKMRGESDEDARRLLQQARVELGSSTDPDAVNLPPYYPRDPVLLRDWAAYLDTARLTDKRVGAVVERLEREGILDSTLVVFTTDHGISHARGKTFLYDEGTQVPLIIRGPGVDAGRVRTDLVEQMDIAAISLAAAGIPMPSTMQARDSLSKEYTERQWVFAARDRCDETVDRIRSVRTDRYLYIRNFHPRRPLLQPHAYKDEKAILQRLRELHAAGRLDAVQEEILFSPNRPVEELYEWQTDRWQIKNLAAASDHRAALESLRERMDAWITETGDCGPESDAMYDSDMAEFITGRTERGIPVDEVKRNIELMKQWSREGK